MEIKEIKSLFKDYKLPQIKSRRTERGDLLDYFLEHINSDRDGVKYKKMNIKGMSHLLSIYKTDDLYILRMKCERAKNFSSTFWYYVKPKATH